MLSGVVDGMAPGERQQLLDLVADRLAPDGVLVVHSLTPAEWASDDAPPEADLAPGHPLRARTWPALLGESGFAAEVHPGPSGRDYLVVAQLGHGAAAPGERRGRSCRPAERRAPVRPGPASRTTPPAATRSCCVRRSGRPAGAPRSSPRPPTTSSPPRPSPSRTTGARRPRRRAHRGDLSTVVDGARDILLACDSPEALVLDYHNATGPEHDEGACSVERRGRPPGRRAPDAADTAGGPGRARAGRQPRTSGTRWPPGADGRPSSPSWSTGARECTTGRPGERPPGGGQGSRRRGLLFVGRLAPAASQHDLVKALWAYRRLYDPRARLHLVGPMPSRRYLASLRSFLDDLGLAGAVRLTGEVSDAALAAYFQAADVYVSLVGARGLRRAAVGGHGGRRAGRGARDRRRASHRRPGGPGDRARRSVPGRRRRAPGAVRRRIWAAAWPPPAGPRRRPLRSSAPAASRSRPSPPSPAPPRVRARTAATEVRA